MDEATMLQDPRSGSLAALDDELMSRALRVYAEVVADPTTYGPQAASLARQARSHNLPEVLVLALRAQAWSERSQLSNERGKSLLDEAVRIARRHKLDDRLSELLVTRAAVNHELGKLVPAQRDLNTAQRLSMGQSAEVTFQQAVLCQNRGQLSTAATLYSLLLGESTVSRAVRAKTANNFSIIQIQFGRIDDAFRLIALATKLAADVGPALAAVVASSRAWISTQSGRLTAGMEQFAEAGRLHESAGLPLAEHYLEYVDALVDLRLIPEAQVIAEKSVDDLKRHGVELMTAEALLRVARLALLLGDLPRATAAAEDARTRCAAQRRTGWRAQADIVLGDIALSSGQATAESLRAVRRAAAVLQRLGLDSHAVEAHIVAGRTASVLERRSMATQHFQHAAQLARHSTVLIRLKGHLANALATVGPERIKHCRAGLADLAQHRATFASIELRVRASGHGAELGQLGLEILLHNGTASQVLSWMERTRAAALVAVEPQGSAEINDDLAALRQIEAEALMTRRETGLEPAPLVARRRVIEDRIRRLTWSSGNQRRNTALAVSTAQLRQSLGGRTLVEFGSLDGHFFAVVLDTRRVRTVHLGLVEDVRRQVDMLLFALRRLARPAGVAAATAAARISADDALLTLERLLFEPLCLAPDMPVVVSPTGVFRRVPWSALRRAPVSVVPAASFWKRSESTETEGKSVLLVAGPELPGAVAEVTALVDQHVTPRILLPPISTIGNVLRELASADLVHMACHGRIRVDNPAFSGLQLQDGVLTLHELEIRGVAPRRLILAACESAVDANYEGNEVLGFVSALMARGTKALIASIVMVPDAAAVPLMRVLHGRLRGGSSFSEALFDARSELDPADPRDMVNWCAFNAYGAA